MGLFDLVKSWLGLPNGKPKKRKKRKVLKAKPKKKTVKKSTGKRRQKKTNSQVRKKTKKAVKKVVKRQQPKKKKNSAQKKKPAGKKVVKQKRTLKPKSSPKPSLKKRKSYQQEIAVVIHYFSKINVGIIKLKNVLRIGRKIHFKGAHDDFVQSVDSMQMNHRDIVLAGRGAEVGIKVAQPVHRGTKVYLVED